MDGTEIDWSAYPAERIKSVIAWVLSAAVTAVLLWKLGREKFRKIAGYAGAALGLMLVLSLGMLMFTTRTEKRETLAATDVNLMSFSDGENLIVVHLDAMDAGVFNEVLAQHPEYRDTFADFTYFDNAMSGYGHTKCDDKGQRRKARVCCKQCADLIRGYVRGVCEAHGRQSQHGRF